MKTKRIVLCAMFIALGQILPFLTGQIPQIGNRIGPMHFAVLIGGLCLGPQFGLIIGATTPLLRCFLFGMPSFVSALCMAFEMATYGLVAGFLYKKRRLPIYVALPIAMVLGRAVWGVASYVILTSTGNVFDMSTFVAGAFVVAWPGIVLQLLLVPLVVKSLEKAKVLKEV